MRRIPNLLVSVNGVSSIVAEFPLQNRSDTEFFPLFVTRNEMGIELGVFL